MTAEGRIEEALRIARDLRMQETRIDGWCSSCHQIDKHSEWCHWTRLLGILNDLLEDAKVVRAQL